MEDSKLLVQYFITDFNVLSCELDNFTFKLLYWVIFYWYYIKALLLIFFILKKTCNTLIIPCQKSKIVSFTSSIMKNIVLFPAWSKFPVKAICCIAFGSASSACYLLKPIAIIL